MIIEERREIMNQYTVILEWSADSNRSDPALMFVQEAPTPAHAELAAMREALREPGVTEEDLDHVITFHGDLRALRVKP